MGPASLRHRSTLLRAHAALCPSHPLVSRCPFPTLPSFISLSCTLARAPIRVTMVRNCLPVDYREKKRTLTDTHLISTTVNVIFENLIHFPSRRIIFGKLDGISRAKEKNLNESFSLVFLMSSRFKGQHYPWELQPLVLYRKLSEESIFYRKVS